MPESKKTTIADVARLAGVGVMTVSRTINGHPYVSEAIAKRVQDAIRKLNYRPSVVAQMLNGRPSSTIGLILPDIADPFFSALTHAVQETAREHRYQVWVAASNSDAEIERLEVEDMISRAVDGLLIVPSRNEATYLRNVIEMGFPLVTIDRFLEGCGIDAVEVENEQGTRVAIEHLIAHRCKRILCFGYDGTGSTINARVNAYRSTMKMAKLPMLLNITAQFVAPSLEETCQAIKKHKPDAIFATNNLSTLRVLEALHQLRIKVPRQISLVGFDDTDPWRVVTPPVTAIRQPVREMGGLAVRILLDRMKNKTKSAVRTMLPVRLVLRGSCGCDGKLHSDA